MNRLITCLLMSALLGLFSVGCGESPRKDVTVRCPKCAAAFTIEEGLKGLSP
jgi:hypothetical protein